MTRPDLAPITGARMPDGSTKRSKVRSLVGLLPLCATTVNEKWQRERAPRALNVLQERAQRMPELRDSIHPTGPDHWGIADRGIFALVNEDRLRRILRRVLDEKEFLSPYGIRALSRYHEDHPYIVRVDGQEYRVKYVPAESDSGMFGGNSNWRGPVSAVQSIGNCGATSRTSVSAAQSLPITSMCQVWGLGAAARSLQNRPLPHSRA
jgi:hypothetical protein